MQFVCPHCSRTIDFSGERPRFCGYCGQALEPSGNTGLDETVDSGRLFRAVGRLPERVGGYEITREIGRGGMGVVCEAAQSGTGRRVALKLLSPKVEPTPETLERFVREGRLAASLSHPRSTFVFDAGVEQGLPYIAMELMPGRTLRELVEQEGPQPVARSVDYLLDAIEGLEAAHAAGVVHRDIKPSNCFLDADGRVKIGDFGLSKSLVDDSALTRTGAFMGTPQFAAPEQIRGGAIDERTDVYALGATLFYLIAGRAPFVGDPASVIAQIVGDPAPKLRGFAAEVPADLDRIVARMLDRDPARRFASLAALRQALLPFATGGTSIADLGRRLAAYMIDNFLAQTVNGLFMGLAGAIVGVTMQRAANTDGIVRITTPLNVNLPLMILGFFPPVLYFALAEAYWGRGVGKWLLGLRVVAGGGQRPAFWQTLVRALFLPGSLGLPVAMAALVSYNPDLVGPTIQRQVLFGAFGTVLCNYVPTLLALSTMRRRNGWRGLHEILTRTRVVRIAQVRLAPPTVLTMTPPSGATAADLPRRCGTFEVREQFAVGPDYRLAAANDGTLARNVWLQIGAAATPSAARCSLGRPMRPRWLQSGVADGVPWQAYEAVAAIPLADALEQIVRVNPPALWDWARLPLAELAEELAAAEADGTLPRSLGMSQVYVQHDGHLKLLDWPLAGAAGEVRGTGVAGAVDLLREAARGCSQGGDLPLHATRFLRELESKPGEAETLTWAAAELRGQLTRPAMLRWDDRLGMLGVSMGTEMVVYSSVAALLPLLLWSFGFGDAAALAVGAALAACLPMLPPLVLGDGPVFRALGIDVRRHDGRPAGRVRRATRDFLAWLPTTLGYAGIAAIILFAISLERHQQELKAQAPPGAARLVVGSDDPRVRDALLGMGGATAFMLGSFVLATVGGITAVVHPSRGVQDFLAGTRLTPQ